MSIGVTVGNYLHRYEAEIARSLLEASGFEAWIMADDAGGMQPHLNFGLNGVRVVTVAEQADEARELLADAD